MAYVNKNGSSQEFTFCHAVQNHVDQDVCSSPACTITTGKKKGITVVNESQTKPNYYIDQNKDIKNKIIPLNC